MPSRAIKTPADREAWALTLAAQQLPITVSYAKGTPRTTPQNKTIHLWYGQAAAFLEADSLDVRAECKLTMGVPILRRDDAAFRAWYDEGIRPMPYAQKLKLFRMLDPAVTSKMNTRQLTEYMEAMRGHFLPMGVPLTDPEARKYEGAA